jgi:hypothetical protein
VQFDKALCTVNAVMAFGGAFGEHRISEFSEEDCFLDREPSGILAVKVTLASHALRYLSRRDSECCWDKLRCEFKTQNGLWDQLNAGEAGNEYQLAQLKSKIECGLAMREGGCDRDAILALEAALIMDNAAADTEGMEASFSKARLCPRIKACAEEVLGQMRVCQARHDLADYLDMVSSLDDRRLDKSQNWPLVMAKACDLKYGVLKEYVSEVIAADAQLRAGAM